MKDIGGLPFISQTEPDISCQLCILPGEFYGCLVGYSVFVHIYKGNNKLISDGMHVGLLTEIS